MLNRLAWIGLVAAIAMLVHWLAVGMIPGRLMGIAMERIEQNAPMNAMGHAPSSTAERRIIVRPSPDLAYSTCLFDLSEGPVAVSVRPMDAPYWSLSVFDDETNVRFVRNDRETGDQPLNIVLAREGQAVPDGSEAVRLPSDRGLALLRILVPERDAFAAIDAARRTASCGVVE